MPIFKVKTHHWVDGVLESFIHDFETIEEALHFSNRAEVHHVKVFDHNNELIHSWTDELNSTYA